MTNGSSQQQDQDHACALVGRFQYHFARVEQKVDQAVIKLLELNEKTASIVTGSVDFAKKLNFVRTYAFEQAGNDADREFGEKTCGAVFGINNDRQVVIHSSFEPAAGGGVQFKRTVASDGRVRVYDQIWDDAKFSQCSQKMSGLEADLDKLIQLLKPAKVPPFDWFSQFPDVIHRYRNVALLSTPPSDWVPRPPDPEEK
jgi:hypothetical protein